MISPLVNRYKKTFYGNDTRLDPGADIVLQRRLQFAG